MTNLGANHLFLSYGEENREFAESLALRLYGEASLSF